MESTWFLTRWQCDDPFLFVKRCRRFTPIKFQKRKFRFLRTAWRRPHPTTSRDGDWLAQMLVCLHVLVKPFIAHHLCTWTKKKKFEHRFSNWYSSCWQSNKNYLCVIMKCILPSLTYCCKWGISLFMSPFREWM